MQNINPVVEVFGQFAVQVNGKVKMFPNRGEAESAAILEGNSANFEANAKAYCLSRDLDPESKMAKAKINVIVDFLAFEASTSEPATAPADF